MIRIDAYMPSYPLSHEVCKALCNKDSAKYSQKFTFIRGIQGHTIITNISEFSM